MTAQPRSVSPEMAGLPARRTSASLPRRFRHILSLKDFEAAARSKLPQVLFGYTSSGAEDEQGLRRASAAYAEYVLVPRFMVGVATVATGTTLFGQSWSIPFGISPMGICAINAYRGDLALAAAASDARIPMIISGSSLIPMEEIAAVNPAVWFQIYLPPSIEQIDALLDRIEAAGIRTIVVTVDVPVGANRETSLRAGFSTPLRPSGRLVLDGLLHPRWLLGTFLRTLATRGMPHFENVTACRGEPIVSRTVEREFSGRAHLDRSHIQHIRRRWKGRVVLKGVLHPEDARMASDDGIDGIIVSNHGARQLDASVSPLHALPGILEVAGGLAVMIDGGIRRGTDVVKALALGADFVFLGRPFNYAATVGGQAGVDHAIRLLSDEVHRTMAQIGITSIEGLKECTIVHRDIPLSAAATPRRPKP